MRDGRRPNEADGKLSSLGRADPSGSAGGSPGTRRHRTGRQLGPPAQPAVQPGTPRPCCPGHSSRTHEPANATPNLGEDSGTAVDGDWGGGGGGGGRQDSPLIQHRPPGPGWRPARSLAAGTWAGRQQRAVQRALAGQAGRASILTEPDTAIRPAGSPQRRSTDHTRTHARNTVGLPSPRTVNQLLCVWQADHQCGHAGQHVLPVHLPCLQNFL